MSESKRKLDAIIAEVRAHDAGRLPGDVDWKRVEERVLAHLPDEPMHQPLRTRSRDALLRGAAVALAAAAAVALFAGKDRGAAVDPSFSSFSSGVAGGAGGRAGGVVSSLRATEGPGEVRVNHAVAAPGYELHRGDSIESVGSRGVFERPGKVNWLLEGAPEGGDGRAQVKIAGESLVLALESGSIEAQVTPVPSGEAFAVDVATDRGVVRVAVHGTHLRVTRNGTHVTVDLTEGVVSIGVPPRTGVTLGTLVTAPAHVEVDATDLSTLKVDHAPAGVRPAVPLGDREASSGDRAAAVGLVGRVDPPLAAARESAPLSRPPSSDRDRAALTKGAASHTEAPTAARPETAKSARDLIAGAVRDCAAARGRSGEVRVTVTSNLSLHVSETGEVESAQFSPPLLPEIQTCAAQTIYRTKLDETGLVTIPIEYAY